MLGGLTGSLGLGGGVVFNPLLLSLGVPTTVTSATSMYLIMFSAASNTLIFLTFGDLNIEYAILIGACSSVAIVLMMSCVANQIKKTGRESIIVFTLAFVILASTVMTPLFGIQEIIDEKNLGLDIWKFNSLCAPYTTV